ncbi:transposase [Lentzea sp. CA-135723]|uniref:transposase n=1 Tax=Lentzea sp. CA-135723 TaxID=3239950 RepID=UPI003D912CBE
MVAFFPVAVACSDGTMHDRRFRTDEEQRRYIRLQRRLARQERGSANRRKTTAMMSRIKGREKNRRRDFVRQIAHRLATDHSLVVLEDLRIRDMTRAGTSSSWPCVLRPGTREAVC